jgi:hypothetical protein
MIALIILAISVVVFLQFFVFYCRSIIAATADQPLPQDVQDVTGIVRSASPEDFARVIQLLKLCPERPEERGQLRAVSTYYKFLGVIRTTIALAVPSLKSWADHERGQCTYFAAVALGRRIAFSRDLLAQQMLP